MYHISPWKRMLYRIMHACGLSWVYVEYEQRILDTARRQRFDAFCKSIGAKKVNGKWVGRLHTQGKSTEFTLPNQK